MRQLELLLGADAFRDGLREYLKRARVRQRDVDRSRRACSTRARRSDLGGVEPRLGRASRGRPTIRTELEVAGRQDRAARVPAGRSADARSGLAEAAAGACSACRPGIRTFDVTLDGAETDVADAAGPAGAAVDSAGRRRARLRLVRSRSGDARVPVDVAPRDRGSAHARRGAGRAVGGDARRQGRAVAAARRSSWPRCRRKPTSSTRSRCSTICARCSGASRRADDRPGAPPASRR